MIDAIGFIASLLSLSAGIPQLFKSMKSKKTHDLSLHTYILIIGGAIMWLWYGIELDSSPIIVTNIISLIINVLILGVKVRYSKV